LGLIWKSRYRKSIVRILAAVAVVGTIVALVPAWRWALSLLPHRHAFPENAIVLSVQPKNEWGELRADGLRRGLLAAPNVGIIRLNADMAKMKTRDIEHVLQDLKQELSNHNVLAVVGPSVSECTVDILEAVESSGLAIPVIIESSVPLAFLGHGRAVPVFRLSSGIDERAREVASMTLELLDSGTPVAYLVERADRAQSYGELLHQFTCQCLGAAAPRVPVHFYDQSAARTLSERKPIADLLRSESVVFFMGLGNDFADFLDSSLRSNAPDVRAKVVGIMCAYRIGSSLRKGDYLTENVYELTDMSPMPAASPSDPGDRFKNAYPSDAFDPSLRDQAFSFDAGQALAWSIAAATASGGMDYEGALDALAAHLSEHAFNGVSGMVALDKMTSGVHQNLSTPLRLARIGRDGKWEVASLSALKRAKK